MAAVAHLESASSTANTTSYPSDAYVPTVGSLQVAIVIASGTVAAGTLVGSTGLTFTRVTSVATGGNTLYAFVADSFSVAESQLVTFGCAEDAATGAYIVVAEVTGMLRAGLSAVRGSDTTAAGSGVTPVVNLPAVALTGNPTIVALMNASNPAAVTEPTGWTELDDNGFATPTTGIEYAARNSGFTDAAITWGGLSPTNHAELGLELDASAPASSSSRASPSMGIGIGIGL